nr:isochorismatase family cysteine hydrolase [Arsenicitalea aurantiaca]
MDPDRLFSDPDRCAHICVDMQRMFAEPTPWHAPWMVRVIPAIAALVEQQAARTIFSRFIPADRPESAPGAWQAYYSRWPMMTQAVLPPDLLDIIPALSIFSPPARIVDKQVYSPWLSGALHSRLQADHVHTLVVTGGETEICVLATVMGAIDLGYRVVIVSDGVCSSADETHDAMLAIYRSRFGQQLAVLDMAEVLSAWAPQPR